MRPIPRWKADPDYYAKSAPEREGHLAHIEVQQRIKRKIMAATRKGDQSYAVLVTREDVRR